MKDLRQITVIGMGLLGGSLSLAVQHRFAGVKVVGYSHRASTRRRARALGVAGEIAEDMRRSVLGADIVVLATPTCTFEEIFREIADSLSAGCIVTDVGSTKMLPHRWAKRWLPRHVRYVGSHPIAGSEQRGVEFARDDLFDGAMCILTVMSDTDRRTVKTLKAFWSALGCQVRMMEPARHDRILASVSHLPHVMAVALTNATRSEELKFAGPGFIDTTRVASGPANIWADILLTNAGNSARAIGRAAGELQKLRGAIEQEDKRQVVRLLDKARRKRNAMMKNRMEEDLTS